MVNKRLPTLSERQQISKARDIFLTPSNLPKKSHLSRFGLNCRSLRRRRISGFGNDILRKILLRLPPKSLLRFQCVSKRWLSIISNPNFRLQHCRLYPTYSSSPAATGLFLYRPKHETVSFVSFKKDDVKTMATISSRFNGLLKSVPKSDERYYSYFHHSCNGLQCFRVADGDIFVYNPTTNQRRLIPKPPDFPSKSGVLNIVFDPSKSQYYKLVQVWSSLLDDLRVEYGFSVYSPKTGVWRDTIERVVPKIDYAFAKGVLHNGELHWVNPENSISFDTDKELLNSKICPFPTHGNRLISYFGECSGCFVVIESNLGKGGLNILQFEKDNSEWILKYDVNLAPLISNWHAEDYFKILYFSVEKEGERKLLILLKEGLISYDIDKEIAENLPIDYKQNMIPTAISHPWILVHQHVETLANV